MHFDFNESGTNIEVHHDGKKAIFDNRTNNKTRCLPGHNIFDESNAFIEKHLNAGQQTALFEIYQEVEERLTQRIDHASLGNYTTMIVSAIYSLIRYEDLKRFIGGLNLPIPDGMLYIHEPTDAFPDRTYVVEEYRELLLLSLALRFMCPVWAAYMAKSKEVVGSQYKEYDAIRLISESWPYTNPAIERLRRYIIASIGSGKAAFDMGRSGLSTSEIPDWLLAGAVVRRVSCGALNCVRDGKSIVSTLYAYMTQKKQQKGGTSSQRAVDKKNTSSRSDDEKDISTIDMYRSRIKHTIGEISVVAVEVRNVQRLCWKIDPDIPESLIASYLAHPLEYRANAITRFHLTMCQWVLGLVIPMEILDDIHRDDLLCALTATRIILQYWGHHQIEGILSSESYTKSIGEDDYESDQPSYGRVAPADMEALHREAPIQRPQGRGNNRLDNIAEAMIAEVVKLIRPQVWVTRFPPGATMPADCSTSGRMSSPKHLKTHLIHLYLKLVKHPRVKHAL